MRPKLILIISMFFLLVSENTLSAAKMYKHCTEPRAGAKCLPNGDIDFVHTKRSHDKLSRAYADFAWNDFLALNFPAKEISPGVFLPQPSDINGLAYSEGSYRTVWQTYIEDHDLFSENVPEFGTPSNTPSLCKGAEGDTPVMVLSAFMQANRMGPVADADKSYVRFNILFNRKMYDYVKARKLNTAAGQEQINRPLNWPSGRYQKNPALDNAGAMMIKASWKILTEKDKAENFHHQKAYVLNKKSSIDSQAQESCRLETVGLIGLHIVHRSNSAPQWVWATFEHRDNAPWMPDLENKRYSLFDRALCDGPIGSETCPYNRIPQHPWQPSEGSDARPSQIVRLAAPGKAALAANREVRKALRRLGNTAWQNYFLVDVQFPTKTIQNGNDPHEINPAYPIGQPTPSFLLNSSMESFIQGFSEGDSVSNGSLVPNADVMERLSSKRGQYTRSGGAHRSTSSCIGCHADGSMVNGVDSGFVFSVERAK